VDFVVTDPPYFDSVQYSDLSHFFRVWLQWFLPSEADWCFDHVTSAVAETEGDADKYRAVMTAILTECNRVLRRPHGRLIFTFHHWRPDAWVRLTLALRDAGFRLLTSYTVHSENPISVHIRQLNALKHDSILVFQPRERHTAVRETSLPGAIRRDDSFGFCRGCAELLGFCLDNNLSDADTTHVWCSALAG
jgi:adenine-specific DNA methylase